MYEYYGVETQDGARMAPPLIKPVLCCDWCIGSPRSWNMIWYGICILQLGWHPPGGSNTVHMYTQTEQHD
jgi:hypothetical protein